jgi:ssDNA-binding Zn-finger/Zn-ribbon topoisomerase 1
MEITLKPIRRKIERIYLHCSASDWGEKEEIRRWHLQRGFSDMGYHFLICNQYPTYSSLKDEKPKEPFNGKLQIGRDIEKPGAHVKYDNRNTIGICLVGTNKFTEKQFEKTQELLKELLQLTNLPIEAILGHYEYWTKRGEEPQKNCPNFDLEVFRERFRNYLKNLEVG